MRRLLITCFAIGATLVTASIANADSLSGKGLLVLQSGGYGITGQVVSSGSSAIVATFSGAVKASGGFNECNLVWCFDPPAYTCKVLYGQAKVNYGGVAVVASIGTGVYGRVYSTLCTSDKPGTFYLNLYLDWSLPGGYYHRELNLSGTARKALPLGGTQQFGPVAETLAWTSEATIEDDVCCP